MASGQWAEELNWLLQDKGEVWNMFIIIIITIIITITRGTVCKIMQGAPPPACHAALRCESLCSRARVRDREVFHEPSGDRSFGRSGIMASGFL